MDNDNDPMVHIGKTTKQSCTGHAPILQSNPNQIYILKFYLHIENLWYLLLSNLYAKVH